MFSQRRRRVTHVHVSGRNVSVRLLPVVVCFLLIIWTCRFIPILKGEGPIEWSSHVGGSVTMTLLYQH